jgi:beta-propeller uncharacterized protein DUF5122
MHRTLRLALGVAAVLALVAAPGTALAKPGGLDRSFAHRGRLVRWVAEPGTWSSPVGAVAGGSGRTLIALAGARGGLARLTATGGLDRTWGAGGLAPLAPATSSLSSILRLPAGRTLLAPGPWRGGDPFVLLNAHGRPDPLGAALRVTLGTPADHAEEHVVALPDGRLLELRGVGSQQPPAPWTVRIVKVDGTVVRSATVPGLGMVGFENPVPSGNGMLVASFDSQHRTVVLRLRPDGTFDPAWGTQGQAIVHGLYLSDAMVPWKGGAIMIGSYGTCVWLDRRGRVLRTRELPLDGLAAHAVDGEDRLLEARSTDGGKTLRVLRLRRNGRLDTSFGDHGFAILRAPHRTSAVGIVVQPHHRIVVVAKAVQAEPEDILSREDFEHPHGTVVWRLLER